MTGFSFVGGNFMLPRLSSWAEVRSQFAAILKSLYKRCASTILTLLIVAAPLALTIYGLGLHVPFLHVLATSAVSTQASPGPVKPKLVRALAASNCNTLQTQGDPLFAKCPSFSVDYSKDQTGSLNTQYFTAYTGAPVANHEAEYYTDSPANVRIANGSLVLEALNQSNNGYQFTSAHVDTHGKEDFLYGKIVVRAKLPSGVGTWPAIWMLPSQPKYASLSPANPSNDGEIDIAEAVGTIPNVVYSVAHTIEYSDDGVNRTYFNTVSLPNDYTAYQDYEVDWTPTSLTFSVDGQTYFTYKKKAGADWHSWPFNQPFYLVMNLAIGGGWGGSDTKDFPDNGVDKSALPASLNVQSVTYYSYTGK